MPDDRPRMSTRVGSLLTLIVEAAVVAVLALATVGVAAVALALLG